MKSIKIFSILLALLLSIFSIAKGESTSDSIKVLFQDGVEIIVSDWTFSYQFGESDKPIKGFSTFYYSYADSKDLFLDLGTKKSHGLTYNIKKKVSPKEIKAIKFTWDQIKMQNASIHLKNGEIIKTDGRPKPDCSEVSKKKHTFGSGDCPCIYLKGTGFLNGQTGEFKIQLNKRKYPSASDRFVEIQFTP